MHDVDGCQESDASFQWESESRLWRSIFTQLLRAFAVAVVSGPVNGKQSHSPPFVFHKCATQG